MFSMDLFLTLSAKTSLFNPEVLNLLTSQMCYCDPLVLFENIVNYLLFSRFWTQHLMISSPLFNPGSIRFCVCYCTWQPSIRYSVLQRLLEISAKCLLINAVPSWLQCLSYCKQQMLQYRGPGCEIVTVRNQLGFCKAAKFSW